MELVLSLFPGCDLLGRSFAAAGFAVVTGPDLFFGQDIRSFHVPPGRFDGVIGGPPCQDFSSARRAAPTGDGVACLREFLRIVSEARPAWFLLENVPRVPEVTLPGYVTQRLDVWDCEFGGLQLRCRHVQFGSAAGDIIRPLRSHVPPRAPLRTRLALPAVTTQGHGPASRLSERRRRQGVPPTWTWPAFRRAALSVMIGNGVPVPVALALARAVIHRSPPNPRYDCACRCGRPLTGRQTSAASVACRQRLSRLARGILRPSVTWP